MEGAIIAGNTISASDGGAHGVKAVAFASEAGAVSVTNASIQGNEIDIGSPPSP